MKIWATNLNNISMGVSPLPNAGVSLSVTLQQAYSGVLPPGERIGRRGSIPSRLTTLPNQSLISARAPASSSDAGCAMVCVRLRRHLVIEAIDGGAIGTGHQVAGNVSFTVISSTMTLLLGTIVEEPEPES